MWCTVTESVGEDAGSWAAAWFGWVRFTGGSGIGVGYVAFSYDLADVVFGECYVSTP